MTIEQAHDWLRAARATAARAAAEYDRICSNYAHMAPDEMHLMPDARQAREKARKSLLNLAATHAHLSRLFPNLTDANQGMMQ